MNKPPMEIYHIYSPMHISFNRERDGDSGINSHISEYPPHIAERGHMSDISNYAVELGDAAPPQLSGTVSGSSQSAAITEAAPPLMFTSRVGSHLLEFAELEGAMPPDIATLRDGATGLPNAHQGEAAPPAEVQLSDIAGGAAGGLGGDIEPPLPASNKGQHEREQKENTGKTETTVKR